MWARGSAIRPVPPHAVLEEKVLDEVEHELADDPEGAHRTVEDAFRRFERSQPELSARIADLLARPMDEVALSLGHFLSIAVWLAFERRFGSRLQEVSKDALRATEESLALEEELRAEQGGDPLDLEDVVATEQPGVLSFVNGHVEAALESPDGTDREVDVDDVHKVYRAIVVMTLALSHAVAPEGGTDGGGEMLA